MTFQATPLGPKLEISIPPDFVGKRIRIELLLDEEDQNQKSPNLNRFRGKINKDLAARMQKQVRNSREEWG